nr:hypothetical protein [Tanacetum cinerariifolium]
MSHTSSVVTYTSVYTDSEPPSPDYIPGLEEPQTPPAPHDEDEHEPMFIQPHDPDFVPEPIYPDLQGDDGDDDDDDSSGYDADDEDEDEEEENLAPTDSAVVIPTDELVSPPEGTDPIIPPPSTDTTTTGARITIRPQTSISFSPEAEVERLLAMPTPSPSPLTSLSPPSAEERLARCTAPATLPSPPLPPSLYPPPPVDHRDDIPEFEQPPRKRLCLSTLGFRFKVGESSTRGRRVDYRDTWIDLAEAVPEMALTTLEKVSTRVTELVELHKHDTQDLYALLEDAQDGRTRISQRVAMDSQRIDLLMGDRMTLQEIVWIVEKEAYAAREAWAHSIGLSQTVQQTEITGLQETDRVRQSQIVETLRVTKDMRREMGDMQAELLALRGKSRRAGQLGGDARVLNHQDDPKDADSHI